MKYLILISTIYVVSCGKYSPHIQTSNGVKGETTSKVDVDTTSKIEGETIHTIRTVVDTLLEVCGIVTDTGIVAYSEWTTDQHECSKLFDIPALLGNLPEVPNE